jgi:ethanolamine utilization protein EutN
MLLGRVKGKAICTIKYPGTEGYKLLVVQPLNKKLEPVGALQVAVDIVHAGEGDLCVMVRSREATLALPNQRKFHLTWRWWVSSTSWMFGPTTYSI